jgi:hypothetical protein
MKTKKIYSGSISFKKETTKSSMTLNSQGVLYKMPETPVERKKELESFGFFGASSDQNKYFPEVTGKNIELKDEDFVYQPFRLLSATIVGAHSWKATDFSDIGVLKRALQLVDAIPIYKDHDTSEVDNAAGIVTTPTWQNTYFDENGAEVPAGINGIFKIDAKTNPKLARNIMLGAVKSNSVTVLFDWEPSHEFEDEWRFFDAIGSVIDGEMVTRKVTKIYDFYETSLVWLGADPFAKKLVDGKVAGVDTQGVFAKETEEVQESYTKDNKYSVLYKAPETLSLKKAIISNIKNKDNMDTIVLAKLLKKLNLEAGTELTEQHLEHLNVVTPEVAESNINNAKIVDIVTEKLLTSFEKIDIGIEESLKTTSFVATIDLEASIVEKETLTLQVAELETVKTSNVELEANKVKLTSDVEELKAKAISDKAEYDALKPMSVLGESYIAEKRTEVERLYSLAMDSKTDEAMLGLIKKATPDELVGMLKQYSAKMVKKFSPKCNDCESENITMRSTFAKKDEKEDTKENTIENLREKYRKNPINL